MQNNRIEFIGELTKKLFSSSRIIGVYRTAHPGEQVLDLVVLINMTETVLKYEAQYNMSLVNASIPVIVNQAFERVDAILQENSQCN